MAARITGEGVAYYDLKKNWRKVKRHLGDERLNAILVRDFNRFNMGRWGRPFTPGMFPEDIESCDWRFNHGRGRWPAYWKYVKHAACHWIVNFSLRLANLAEPSRHWRIVTTQAHSTVWDGDKLLFDFNFQALGVPAEEAFVTARRKGRVLAVGKELRTYFAEHYTVDFARRDAVRAAAASTPGMVGF